MIRFTKLRYKNILSTGDIFTEIDLDRNRTTLISGSNGAGKSTTVEALIFVLYGRSFRKITKPQLVNSVNKKDLLVEIEFEVGKISYKIRRGIKPNIFEIYNNGEMIDQSAAVRDYQEYLEENILKINFKSFTQIVILGSATYVPFMELPAASRRDVIEDLLDIQVFGQMNMLLKERVSENKSLIIDNKHSKELIETKITSAKEHNDSILKMKQVAVDGIKDKVKEYLNRMEEDNKAIEELEQQVATLNESVSDKSDLQGRKDKLRSLERDLNSKVSALTKEIDFYKDHDDCPTCRQGIEPHFKQSTVDEKTSERQKIVEGLEQLKERLATVEERLKEIDAVESNINKLNLTIGEHRVSVNMAMRALKGYKKDLQEAEKDVQEVDNTLLEGYNDNLRGLIGTERQLLEDKDVLAVVAAMLKDGGIKTRIIGQYVPIMNKLINKFLASFELFVDFHLDENFNEVIKSRYRDAFSYSSFSEGEKLRISLAILLTWRAISKMRNSVSTNLLILDETLDGSADAAGVEALIDLLHDQNPNDNIFVISHRGDTFGEKFDSHIRIEKVKGFSTIAE